VNLSGRARRTPDEVIEVATCNNAPAVFAYRGDPLEGVLLVEIVDGRIINLYAVRNPDKLAAVAVPRRISR
jgi:RNA polymerase sigma-70 factor, ECF subfamily